MRRKQEAAPVPAGAHKHELEAEGGIGGAITGAALGAAGGPPGIVVGAVLGGVVGALAAHAVEQELDDQARKDHELDATIGVTEGSLGAPNLEHPPAITGAYSAASSGAGAGGGVSAPPEGPMQEPDD